MSIMAECTEMPYGCGVHCVGAFTATEPAWWRATSLDRVRLSNMDLDEPMGTGYAIAAFINDEVCQEAYQVIKDTFPIVFQSEVRVNENTGNKFFFIVYDTR